MTINGAIMQLVEMRENSMMPMVFKPYFDKVIETISECEEPHPQPQWIPCSERLPDVAQRVLLSGHGKVMIGRLHSVGKYTLEPTGISYIYPKDAIEAWMPLPEPPMSTK